MAAGRRSPHHGGFPGHFCPAAVRGRRPPASGTERIRMCAPDSWTRLREAAHTGRLLSGARRPSAHTAADADAERDAEGGSPHSRVREPGWPGGPSRAQARPLLPAPTVNEVPPAGRAGQRRAEEPEDPLGIRPRHRPGVRARRSPRARRRPPPRRPTSVQGGAEHLPTHRAPASLTTPACTEPARKSGRPSTAGPYTATGLAPTVPSTAPVTATARERRTWLIRDCIPRMPSSLRRPAFIDSRSDPTEFRVRWR